MAIPLTPGEHIEGDVTERTRELLVDALDRLDRLAAGAPGAVEHVHEVRKRCKEARSLARLVRPSLGDRFERFDRLVRDAAAELSSMRDDQAFADTLGRLRAATPDASAADFERVGADHEIAGAGAVAADDPHLTRARRLLTRAAGEVGGWELAAGFAAIGAGLGDTYRRGRRALRRAQRRPTDDRVHRWRKTVKQLLYQIRLLEPCAPSALAPLAESLDRLADALGDDHDLAVLAGRLTADRDGPGPAGDGVVHAARAQQAELRSRALRLGSTIYVDSPAVFVDRMSTFWRLTLELGPERPTGGLADLREEPDDRGSRRGTATRSPPGT